MKFKKKRGGPCCVAQVNVFISHKSLIPPPFFLDFPHFPYQIFVFVSIAPDNKDNNNAGPRRKTML